MLVPIIKCRTMKESVSFYTQLLDFEHVGTWPASGDPSFSILARDGAEIFLSSHAGDGVPGQAVAVLTDDVNALWRKYVERGLDSKQIAARKPDSPVHRGVVKQTWGTLEFYVDDPDGNTLRFVQRRQ
jgi:catechol 2,3-dioxygenase-like lactoylglutathione lyase family enzyme